MKNKGFFIKVFLIIGDIIFVNLSFLLSFYLRFRTFPARNFSAYISLIPYISIFTVIVLYLYNLYSNQLKKHKLDILYSFIPASCIIVLFSVALSYFFQTYAVPRSVFLIVVPVMIYLMIFWRYLSFKILKIFYKPQNIIVVGKGREAISIIENIIKGTNGGYNLLGTVIEEKEDINYNFLNKFDLNIITGFSDLSKNIKKLNPDLVFISGKIDEKYKNKLFYQSLEEDWEVSLVPGFYEIMLAGAEMEQIGELPVYEMKRLQENEYGLIKRMIDFVLAALGLIISSPLIVVVSVLIKLESRGPIFFTQERISKGRIFTMYKFRTMVADAEKNTGPILSKENDKRITKIGKILRKTRIDEIPQLFNVLKGDMSFIGPRPERPHFNSQFEKEIENYKYRHRIKSGITGLAQVMGTYSSDPEDKLRLDLLYANKSSFFFDLKIILHTMKVIFMDHKAS